MNKYIDAEKLIAEIERYENTAIDAYNPLGEDADFWHGRVVACEDLKTFITSLQQEQPSFPSNLDEAAIQAAQIDMSDRQIMEDSNEHRMLYSRIFRRGFKAGAKWQQEQPEGELGEHKIADIIQNLFPTDQFIESESLLLDKEEAIFFARHFYNLALADVRAEVIRLNNTNKQIAKEKKEGASKWQEGVSAGYADVISFIDNLTK